MNTERHVNSLPATCSYRQQKSSSKFPNDLFESDEIVREHGRMAQLVEHIMCPESNKCLCCEKFGHFDFDNFRPASLDALYAETEYEPAADHADLFDDTTEVMEMLVQRLTEI